MTDETMGHFGKEGHAEKTVEGQPIAPQKTQAMHFK
jgi:hypothetical protein